MVKLAVVIIDSALIIDPGHRHTFSICSWPVLLQVLIMLGIGSLVQMWCIHFCYSHEEHRKWKSEHNFWYPNQFIDHISLHMVLPGHNGLIISEKFLFENFVNGLKLTWYNGSIVEVWEFHPTFYRAGYYWRMLGLKLIHQLGRGPWSTPKNCVVSVSEYRQSPGKPRQDCMMRL